MSFAVVGLSAPQRPIKRRRTATTIFAGDFDPRPPRDVLTSLLNGVGPYKLVEGDEEERRQRKRERKLREKEKKREKKLQARSEQQKLEVARKQCGTVVAMPSASGQSTPSYEVPAVNSSTSSFWRVRGPAVVATRSVSPTPPPDFFSPPTPGPSVSSETSRTSSKRPFTPEDGYSLSDMGLSSPPPMESVRMRKKRAAARKGWKGWVEGSPPPSDKLINLDSAPVMVERRTRSGKNFDAICEGQEGWVDPEH